MSHKRFDSGWYFVGRGNMLHFFTAHNGSIISRCGIHASLKRLYSGTGTKDCEDCLKSMKENGKIKR